MSGGKDFPTKEAAYEGGVSDGWAEAAAAYEMRTDIMDPARLARAVTKMTALEDGGRLDPGGLMPGSPTPMEFAVELSRHYNAEES